MDFTVVVGVDKHCLGYLEHTVATWRHNQPGLFSRPWIVFYDPTQLPNVMDVKRALMPYDCRYVPWLGSTYANQREKMLSGHVYISRLVETPYSLKIDCDAIAMEPVEFPKVAWFEDDPVLVGPSWGYTRAKPTGEDLFVWVETMEKLGDTWFGTPRAGWKEHVGSLGHRKGPKMGDGHGRFVSWLGFQRTDWVCEMAARFESECGAGRLPLPSHDTSLWMAAVRQGALMRYGKAMKAGWTNRVSKRGCREAAAIACGAESSQ